MRKLSPEEEERKKFIFDSMSPRLQKHILKKEGYDNWDPFMEPKDPIDIRDAKSRGTAVELVRQFLATCKHEEYSNEYGQGVWDLCLGIQNNEDRYKGMYEFSCWYREFLEKQGQA